MEYCYNLCSFYLFRDLIDHVEQAGYRDRTRVEDGTETECKQNRHSILSFFIWANCTYEISFFLCEMHLIK